MSNASQVYRPGDRVEIIDAPPRHPHFVGELGTVWCADRKGAVVTLDSRGVADTRFAVVELRPVVAPVSAPSR